MPDSPILSPQILGQAEAAHRALLDRILVKARRTYNEWIALSLIIRSGEHVERDALCARMVSAVKADAGEASGAIDNLISAGLLAQGAGDGLALTDRGQAQVGEIRGAIDDVMGRVYADIARSDLEAAGRVLALVTTRANAELSG